MLFGKVFLLGDGEQGHIFYTCNGIWSIKVQKTGIDIAQGGGGILTIGYHSRTKCCQDVFKNKIPRSTKLTFLILPQMPSRYYLVTLETKGFYIF